MPGQVLLLFVVLLFLAGGVGADDLHLMRSGGIARNIEGELALVRHDGGDLLCCPRLVGLAVIVHCIAVMRGYDFYTCLIITILNILMKVSE